VETFANELARRIRSHDDFWSELATLRAAGICASIPSAGKSNRLAHDRSELPLRRLLSSASVFSQANDDESLDLAQQIAVFSTLASDDPSIREGAIRILAELGNFPSLNKSFPEPTKDVGLQTFLNRKLLQELQTVTIGDKEVSLTNFQARLWTRLKKDSSALAVSAPTSAGKSFLILEHLCLQALAAKNFLAIYIAPTRALLAEVHAKLEKRLGAADSHIRTTTIPVVDPLKRPKQIYVLTQERVQVLLPSIPTDVLIDLVIVDEAQSLGDDGRGMILQDCLERLQKTFRTERFLFLAPGVSNLDSIQESIGLDSIDIEPTMVSPVVQNRIAVTLDPLNEHRLVLALLRKGGREHIANLTYERGFASNGETARLAAVALELGKGGRSLVYATGAVKAEELAIALASNRNELLSAELLELSKFVQTHVHKKYSLARYIRHGVAFHYGNMPSVLREAIENAFRLGKLEYLACTTTLFQGVNLPARNVFIHTPTRGNKGEILDEAALWNFAGRAGRLGEETVGNVFLIDYDTWPVQKLDDRKPFPLAIAFKATLTEDFDGVIETLDFAARGERPSTKVAQRARSAAGLLLLRQSQGGLSTALGYMVGIPQEQQQLLHAYAEKAIDALKLPAQVLVTNWVVDPVGMAALLARFRKGIEAGKQLELIPGNPSGDSYPRYRAIVYRMYKYLVGVNLTGQEAAGTRGYYNFVATSALKWMKGDALQKMVADAIRYQATQRPAKSPEAVQHQIDTAIRKTFELVEKILRFEMVQLGKAYVDLLRIALTEAGLVEDASMVYDFSLSLELGVSTQTGRTLVELGLSRMTATVIADLVADSAMDTSEVKSWLQKNPIALSTISPLIRAELEAKSLIPALVQDGDTLS
jgi:superfamily II DNA or RNA helicase